MVKISPLLFVSDAAGGHKFIACMQTSLYFLCCTRKSDICFYAIASRVSVFRCVAYSIFHTTKSLLVSTSCLNGDNSGLSKSTFLVFKTSFKKQIINIIAHDFARLEFSTQLLLPAQNFPQAFQLFRQCVYFHLIWSLSHNPHARYFHFFGTK